MHASVTVNQIIEILVEAQFSNWTASYWLKTIGVTSRGTQRAYARMN